MWGHAFPDKLPGRPIWTGHNMRYHTCGRFCGMWHKMSFIHANYVRPYLVCLFDVVVFCKCNLCENLTLYDVSVLRGFWGHWLGEPVRAPYRRIQQHAYPDKWRVRPLWACPVDIVHIVSRQRGRLNGFTSKAWGKGHVVYMNVGCFVEIAKIVSNGTLYLCIIVYSVWLIVPC